MQTVIRWTVVWSIALTLLSLGVVFAETSQDGSVLQTGMRKIVVFEDGTSYAERDEAVREARAVRVKRLHRLVEADVLYVDEEGAAHLRAHPKVKRVEEDVLVFATEVTRDVSRAVGRRETAIQSHRKPKPPSQPAQSLPWGVDRIDAERVWPSGNTADAIKVGVIDTGINLSHPDLAANIKGGVNTIQSWKNAEDDNGHGSHVAGTIAALNNLQGVIGVAPQADLYAIKVLNAQGSGYLSDVIEGIDFAVANGLDVINMSLGTSADVQSFHDAIVRAYDAGVITVVAAGNNGGVVSYPAAYPEVIAVSATDQSDVLASWSNRGAEIDFAAPGVSIYSTYRNQSYGTLSGTSMATPHVAGTVALVLATPIGGYDANGNGAWDQGEVVSKLRDTATDLGSGGFDTLYGWGLVNAYQATR